MKYLELDQDTERQLALALDFAVKGAGLNAVPVVHAVMSKIKEKTPEEPK